MWYQGCTTLLPGRYQPGTRLIPIWYLVPGWYQAGTSLVPGTSVVPGWYQTTRFPYISPICHRYQSPVVCQNPDSKWPTRGLKIILMESEGTPKFSKCGATGTRLVPEWHQTRGSTSLSPRCPWWQKPGHGHPWLPTHGWLAIAAQPRPASDAPRRPAPFPLSIVSRFLSRVGPRRVPPSLLHALIMRSPHYYWLNNFLPSYRALHHFVWFGADDRPSS